MEGAATRQPSVMSSVNRAVCILFRDSIRSCPQLGGLVEDVFDAPDADGNGFLTPEEFTTDFSKF